ncbi:MAG: PAS domain S-box protein [Coriobacteriia bacterium]
MEDRWLEAARTGELQRGLVETLPLPVLLHDQEIIVYANQACVRFARATGPEELVGKKVLAFVHPDGGSAAQERVRLVYERDLHVRNAECKIITLDGATIRCTVAGFPVHVLGRDLIAVVITEHERVERD